MTTQANAKSDQEEEYPSSFFFKLIIQTIHHNFVQSMVSAMILLSADG